MNELNEYRFEQITHAHYPLLQILFKDAFHQYLSIEEINKRFDTASLCARVIGFIAIHTATQQPAAYYGVFPLQLSLNGKQILAAQSGDTMTHRAHRKKGLFVQLATLTYEVCKQGGIQLLYGSPNASSYKGLVHHLQWEHREDIIRYDLKLTFKTIPFPKLFSAYKKPRSLYFTYAKYMLGKYMINPPANFHHQTAQHAATVFRNKAYIDYKTDANKYFIQIEEVIFWIKLSDVLWIGDLSDTDKVTASTLKQLKQLAFRLGYNTIVMNLNESIVLADVFSEFKPHDKDAACYKMLQPIVGFERMIWTGADFDTW